jgi:hypothetical protein
MDGYMFLLVSRGQGVIVERACASNNVVCNQCSFPIYPFLLSV